MTGPQATGPGRAATVGPGGTVIAAGSAATTTTGQQAILLRASTAGAVQPVLPGVAIPQWRQQPGRGRRSAGRRGQRRRLPVIWYRTAGCAWRLVSSLSLVSANPGQAALISVTHGPAGWLAAGIPDPVAYTSWDLIVHSPPAFGKAARPRTRRRG